MRLRTEFSLLLCGCIFIAVLFTSAGLSRSFTSDQEAYLGELQSTLALFTERQLRDRLEDFHANVATLVSADGSRIDEISLASLAYKRGQLWRNTKLMWSFPRRPHGELPPEGSGAWTIIPSPEANDFSEIRWVGRFGQSTLVLDFASTWLKDALEFSHGATTQLIRTDGTVLLRSSNAPSHVQGARLFHGMSALSTVYAGQPGIPQTLSYRSVEETWYLGTFVLLSSSPSLIVAVSTPWSAIQSVIRRTYAQSAWIACLCLLLAVFIGLSFSARLTKPLKAIAELALEVAKGKFGASVAVGLSRWNEIGVLARSFNKMSRDLHKLQTELRKSERLAALGMFSAGIAHGIKNPLAGILGNAQVAKIRLQSLSKDGAKEILENLQIVEEETYRVNKIVMDLMKFARQEGTPTQPIDLAARIRRSLAIIRPTIEQAGVQFEARVPETPIPCIAHEEKIHEALLNLIENSLHALREACEKKLTVSLEAKENTAVLTVEDSGAGIPPQVRDHIFEPFFTTKKIGEGTGLGLAVCHGIITSHLGKISVDSELGKGTRFVISLPLAHGATQRAA